MKHLKEILELPVNEKIHLVETLWDSITLDTATIEIPQSQIDESLKRLEHYRKYPEAAITLDQLKERLKTKARK
ncbi:MAG: addiction module protein [Bacteroidetes bacterium]|nr:addiction module protein [Bacteroidota bacterium]